ncbi:hypothetical protein PPYR_00518 [Photinus pyralis]|uniref:Uncharacterized protein n=1 Tax=Photinus pyralis TaxID=7054 RepID=A0A5N4B201_PHOPY|nr:uncharacterized protein LOC116160049 [Photinus pyralis]KAB0803548.1 hypothetical protein PPYR_00518 [Photinus pyralis]
MTLKPVTLLIFLLASSTAWDFDLLVETIYDHFESYEYDDSAESENSTQPASTTSSVTSSSTPSTTPPSPPTPSTTTIPPSSSPPSTSATSPVVLAAPVPDAAPSTRRKREVLHAEDGNQFKRLYENVPYPSRYAPNYQGPLWESTNNKENHREARKSQHVVKAKSGDSTKVELIKLLLKLVEESENEKPKHDRPNVVQRILIKMPQVQHEVIDDSNQKDREKCKSDDKNYITCVTDRKVVETVKINPVDHSEVRKIHENIKVSIMKNDKLPPDTKEEAIDKVFKHEPSHVGPMSYEEDDYHPYPYHHRNDYKGEKNRRRHRPDYLSSRFNAEDEKKDSGKEAPSTPKMQK